MTPAVADGHAVPFSPFGEVTVSRMGVHSLHTTKHLASRTHSTLPRQAKGMRMRYSPQPIEFTLRQRQALQPSASEPSLATSSSTPSLPKIGSGAASPQQLRAGRSAIAARTASATAGPGAVGANSADDVVVADRFVDLREEAWLGILNGGRRVAIPFGNFAETIGGDAHWLHKANTDPFVRWYRSAEAEAARPSLLRPSARL